MIENREKEWQQLESTARQMLDNPRLLPIDSITKNFTPTLHLWISPTFTPEKHWVFYQPQPHINPQPTPIVQQIIWQKDADFQRLNNPLIGLQNGFHSEPTLEIKTIEIENEKFQKLLTQLSKVYLPPFIQPEMNGRDGEVCGVETLDYFYSGRITWWSEHPKVWQDLANWFEKVRKFLEEHFNDG